jgi:hypothetical protein
MSQIITTTTTPQRLTFIVIWVANDQYCNNFTTFTFIVGHVANSQYCNNIIGLPLLSVALQTINIATMLQRLAFIVGRITNNQYCNNTIGLSSCHQQHHRFTSVVGHAANNQYCNNIIDFPS